MAKTKLTKTNFPEVMKAIREEAGSDGRGTEDDARVYVDTLTNMLEALVADDSTASASIVKAMDHALDDLVSEDFFGTEAQNDPRGDQRD